VSGNPGPELLEQFSSRAAAMGAELVVVPRLAEASAFIESFCTKQSLKKVLISPQARKLLGGSKLPLLDTENLKNLDEAELGIVAADYGIAETGTLVHFHEHDLEKLVGVLPLTCISVLEAGKIVRSLEELVPEINEQLGRTGLPGPQVSLVSGPSRTADIECRLCIGVHGPARLVILVVEGARE